jgi:hypothetical protein
MERIYFLAVLLLCAGIIQAQEDDNQYGNDQFKTIFGGRSIGGYGGFGLGYSMIDSRHALTFDARGGIVMGHSLSMGIGGAGFINEYEYDPQINKDVSLVGGYGGFYIEPILFPKMPVHLSFPVFVGMGGAAYTSFVKDENGDYTQDNEIEETSSIFLVIEPSAELEFNLTRFFRLAAFLSYRYTSGVEIPNVPSDVLNTYTAGLRFKFGKF